MNIAEAQKEYKKFYQSFRGNKRKSCRKTENITQKDQLYGYEETFWEENRKNKGEIVFF